VQSDDLRLALRLLQLLELRGIPQNWVLPPLFTRPLPFVSPSPGLGSPCPSLHQPLVGPSLNLNFLNLPRYVQEKFSARVPFHQDYQH